MPSAASARIEKQPSLESSNDAQKQVQTLVDKKIRNLEKRKTKLDTLRGDFEKNKELNDDQKNAIKKYDTVVEILDFLKELNSSLTTIFTEHNKVQKKTAKRESVERQQQEIERLKTILLFQEILGRIDGTVRTHFLEGSNGAIKLSDEKMGHFDELYTMVDVSSNAIGTDEFSKHLESAADKLIHLAEGRNRPAFKEVTYKSMKETLLEIANCGYFNRDAVRGDDPNLPVTSGDTQPQPAQNDTIQLQNESTNSVRTFISKPDSAPIEPNISFTTDTIHDPIDTTDPAIAMAVSSSNQYPYQFSGQSNEAIVQMVPPNGQKIVEYGNTIQTQTFTNQNYMFPAMGTIITPQIPPQNVTPHFAAPNEMQIPQQSQSYHNQQSRGFTDYGDNNEPDTSHGNERGMTFQNDDSYGQRNNFKNTGRGFGRNVNRGSSGNNQVNGYNNRNSGATRNKGYFSGTFQSNRDQQQYNGSTYGNKNKGQYSGPNRGTQQGNRSYGTDRNNGNNYPRNK